MGKKFFHDNLQGKSGTRPSSSWGRVPFVCLSVAREQPAEDADAATDEQETGSEQQQRGRYDGISNSTNVIEDSSANLGKISNQSFHSVNNRL